MKLNVVQRRPCARNVALEATFATEKFVGLLYNLYDLFFLKLKSLNNEVYGIINRS